MRRLLALATAAVAALSFGVTTSEAHPPGCGDSSVSPYISFYGGVGWVVNFDTKVYCPGTFDVQLRNKLEFRTPAGWTVISAPPADAFHIPGGTYTYNRYAQPTTGCGAYRTNSWVAMNAGGGTYYDQLYSNPVTLGC